MKCLIMFSGKCKKNIANLLSAELAKIVVMVYVPSASDKERLRAFESQEKGRNMVVVGFRYSTAVVC